jgi:hypothetical protein
LAEYPGKREEVSRQDCNEKIEKFRSRIFRPEAQGVPFKNLITRFSIFPRVLYLSRGGGESQSPEIGFSLPGSAVIESLFLAAQGGPAVKVAVRETRGK